MQVVWTQGGCVAQDKGETVRASSSWYGCLTDTCAGIATLDVLIYYIGVERGDRIGWVISIASASWPFPRATLD